MPRVLGRRIRCGSVVAPAEDIAGIGRRVRYGLGNGLGYSLILVIVGTCRELLGSGTLLGYQILKPVTEVGWYYTNGMMLLAPDMEILRAIHALVEKRISGAPVVDARGNLVGVLSEQDCMRVALDAGYHGQCGGHVEDFMNRDVRTVEADTSILQRAQRLIDGPYRRYPVVENNRLVGQISRRDVLRALEALS